MEYVATTLGVVCVWVLICYTVYKMKQSRNPMPRLYRMLHAYPASFYSPTRTIPGNNTDHDSMGEMIEPHL
jgi:hypothetical protein